MESVRTVNELPPAPAVYAMYGGAGREYVAYVGLAGDLRGRIKQHLVNRDSSVTTGTSAAGLNPDHIRAVEWWSDPDFADRTTLQAAELVAFDVLQPALRSRGGITADVQELADDNSFQARINALLRTPSGRLDIPQLIDVLERLAELEARVARLEAEPVAAEQKNSSVNLRDEQPDYREPGEGSAAAFTIYVDGSGTTGGPAGVGFVVLSDGVPPREERVPVPDANHQQAELLAATYPLESLPAEQEVVLRSDSRYVVKGFAKVDGEGEYLPEWRARNWRKLGGGPVLNVELWQRLVAAVERHRSVRFELTPRTGNKQAHRLAGEARKAALLASESERS